MLWLKKYKIILTVLLIAFTFLLAQTVSAQGVIWNNTGDCYNTGTCTSCDMIQVIVNIGVFLLGVVGAVALLFFTYGAFILLTSGGASERVQKGKGIMVNSIIGLIISLSAYFIVSLVITVVTGGWSWEGNLQCSTAGPTPAPSPSATPTPSPSRACGSTTIADPSKKCQIDGAEPLGFCCRWMGPEYACLNECQFDAGKTQGWGIKEASFNDCLPTADCYTDQKCCSFSPSSDARKISPQWPPLP